MMKVEEALGLPPDAVLRLGALAVFVVEDAERLRERLRLSNVESRRLESMGDRWWRIAPAHGNGSARALLYRIGVEAYRDRVLLAFARSPAKVDDSGWRGLAVLPTRWTAPKFPLAAKDFLDRGLAKGPALGAALARAEAAWIAADFPADPAKIGAIAEEAAKAAKEN